MGYPLKTEYQKGKGLSQIPAGDLRTIANMLNGLQVVVCGNAPYATVTPPDQEGKGWKLNIPAGGGGSGLPSNAGKSKWMIPTLSADNATETDDPTLWTVDWIRAHA